VYVCPRACDSKIVASFHRKESLIITKLPPTIMSSYAYDLAALKKEVWQKENNEFMY
jgi:hypothetical protein